MFRMKNSGNRKEIRVKPDGGVNLSRLPENIDDNQSSDMLNMWNDSCMLRLRPGLCRTIEQQYGPIVGVYPRDGHQLLLKRITCSGTVTQEKHGIYIVTGRAVLSYDGAQIERLPTLITYDNSRWNYYYDDFSIASCVLLPADSFFQQMTDGSGETWKGEGDTVFLFGSGYFLTIAPQVIYWPFPIGEVHVTADYVVSYRSPYVPTITTDTKPAGSGTADEPRNFLTPQVTQAFTADSSGTVYKLADSGLDNGAVCVVYTNPATGVTLDYEIAAGQTSDTQGGISVTVDRSAGTVTFGTAPVGASGVKNNVQVTYSKTVYAANPVFQCSVGSWYGGTMGQTGGNRIFLSGNTGAPSTLYYSAADNPGYFPDDAMIAVGDPADPVTAFGEQFNILVIFKKFGIYSLSCSGSGEDASYSVTLVHSGDGCDMPGSVQLVRNVLTWANSRDGIFLLHSTQIKDERAVVNISRNINSRLLALDAATLAGACSAADGHGYLLFAGENVFVWQFDSLSAKNSQLVQDENLYNFVLWKLPHPVNCAFLYGGAVYAADGSDGTVYRFDDTQGTDDGEWFDAYWCSKSFDFGVPEVLKQPVGLWVRMVSGEPVRADVACGDASEEEPVTVRMNPENDRPVAIVFSDGWAAYIRLSVRRVRDDCGRFGIAAFTLQAVEGPRLY